VDDILMPGNDLGLIETLKVGSNGYGFSNMLAGAARWDGVSAASAFSYRDSDNYKIGEVNGVRKERGSTWQELKSGLAKLNLGEGSDHSLSFGGVWYDSDAAQRGDSLPVTNQTYTAKYAYDPDSELIDLRINTSFNITEAEYTSG